ncbi:MAG: restriction endonuclease [Acidobacteria bacterium]|nr:MAG: restriction endonuclease [Acidobacteriota bacterium]
MGLCHIKRLESNDTMETSRDAVAVAKDLNEVGPKSSAQGSRITIVQAIEQVIRERGRALTIIEIHDAIVAQHLYEFKADNPVHIVGSQVRRHCLGLDFPSAAPNKLFKTLGAGKYDVLEAPIRQRERKRRARPQVKAGGSPSLESLRRQHERYIAELRSRILDILKKLTPQQFEHFCRNLLKAYGFKTVTVTRNGRDGGIDGNGQLKVGFDFFDVAFQCKRWGKANVGRPELNQFRGDIQGQSQMGVFFTTSKFTPEAKVNSVRLGAVPITLIDGRTIVDIMLEKSFGVEREDLPIYSLALDMALTE